MSLADAVFLASVIGRCWTIIVIDWVGWATFPVPIHGDGRGAGGLDDLFGRW